MAQFTPAYTLAYKDQQNVTHPATFTLQNTSNTRTYFGGRMLGDEDRLGSRGGKYFPYGDDRSNPPPANDQVKFATYTGDSATGLDYADQRYYSSTYGRFASPDQYVSSGGPASPQSWNRYAYVQGDPVNYTDRRGLYMSAASVSSSASTEDEDDGQPGSAGQAVGSSSAKAAVALGQQKDGSSGGGGDPQRVFVPPPPAPYRQLDPAVAFIMLIDAEALAEQALANNECSNLFNTTGTGPDPLTLLRSIFDNGIDNFSDYGRVVYASDLKNDTPAGTYTFNFKSTVELNDNANGPFANQCDICKAVTLLHELGHVYNQLFGPNSSALALDSTPVDPNGVISGQNTTLISMSCFK